MRTIALEEHFTTPAFVAGPGRAFTESMLKSAPGAKIVAIMGDGSFGFTVGELETICRLRIPLALVVISNFSYGWIKAGQKSGFGERYFSVDFSRTDHAAVASAFGVKSYRVEDPEKLGATLKLAVEANEPVLVDVLCQPLEQARAPVSEWIA